VQFAKVQLQRVEEPPVCLSTARGGRRLGRGEVRGVGQAQQQRFQKAAPQGVMQIEGAAPEGAVFVQQLQGCL
jgi:hypothetical protein